MKRMTALLADDHRLRREGLRKSLELEADIEVVGEAQDGRQTIALAKQLRPAVVLMDIAMPLLNGLKEVPASGDSLVDAAGSPG